MLTQMASCCRQRCREVAAVCDSSSRARRFGFVPIPTRSETERAGGLREAGEAARRPSASRRARWEGARAPVWRSERAASAVRARDRPSGAARDGASRRAPRGGRGGRAAVRLEAGVLAGVASARVAIRASRFGGARPRQAVRRCARRSEPAGAAIRDRVVAIVAARGARVWPRRASRIGSEGVSAGEREGGEARAGRGGARRGRRLWAWGERKRARRILKNASEASPPSGDTSHVSAPHPLCFCAFRYV